MSTSENRPWILMVAGIAVLIVISVIIRSSLKSDVAEEIASVKRPDAASPLSGNRSGWGGRGESASGPSGQAGGESPRLGGSRSLDSARGGGTDVRTEGRGETQTERSGPSILQGLNRAGRRQSGTTYTERGSIQAGGGIQTEGSPFKGLPLSGSAPSDSGSSVGLGAGLDPTKPENVEIASNDVTDENQTPEEEPVLSLPFNNSTQSEKGDVAPIVEEGITFESGEGAKFSVDSQFVIPNAGNLNGDSGTLSFEIKPEWSGEDPDDASLIQLRTANAWDNRIQIFKNGRYLRFLIADNTGSETDASAIIDDWRSDEPHHITATWGRDDNGAGTTSFFIDGRLIATRTFDGRIEIPQGTPLYIGSDLPGSGPGARGSLSNLKAWNRPLSQQEIANLGSGKH